MNRHSVPPFLLATLLCGCGTQGETPDPPSPSRPAEETIAGQPTGDGEAPGLGDYVAFPSSGVQLRQPEGFEKSDSFDGFGQPETQSSVLAVSVPAPLSKLAAGFTREQMAARGWTLLSRREVEIGGSPGILVHFEQPAGGDVFLKWSAAFGDDRKTTMVTATFPRRLERGLSARLKATVLSARPDRAAASDPGAGLPFTVAGSRKLKPTPGISKTLVYTKDGAVPAKSPEDPLFIVAPSLGQGAIGDRRQFAERRVRETAHTKRVSVTSTDAVTIDGLDGYETLAEAEDAKSGTPLLIYQVVLFDGGSYIRMQGLVGAELRDEYLPEFRAMTRSLRRKKP